MYLLINLQINMILIKMNEHNFTVVYYYYYFFFFTNGGAVIYTDFCQKIEPSILPHSLNYKLYRFKGSGSHLQSQNARLDKK